MSSIFNLLGGLAEPDEGQIKHMERSKTFHEFRLNSVKREMGGTKPKGLSIRSNSEMNIPKKSMPGEEQDCSKLKVTQVDYTGRPISPGKQTPAKKLVAQSPKLKDFALKEDTKCKDNKCIFKKPLLPKKNIKRTPKPEKLAHWCDNQHDFDCGYIEVVEKEFKDLLSKKKESIKPCDKNVLLSDSKNVVLLDIPKLIVDTSPNEELLSLDLPNVSDISDNEVMNEK